MLPADPILENTDADFFQTNYLNNNLSVNFKELSVQLFSHFSSLNSSNLNPQNPQQASAGVVAKNADEFIDNEIYKFVLNGKKQVSVPPGFEVNTKEVQEIEELGKKIATFQIETDTEMSIFNTDDNASSISSANNSDNNGEDANEDERLNKQKEEETKSVLG